MAGDGMGIGAYGEAVGLSTSALRFYDRVGVLVPADVDARTGYRRYRTDQVATGQLVSRLRRIGVGVADLRALASGVGLGPESAALILDRHLERLEAGLADARAELEWIRSTLRLPANDQGPQRQAAIVTVLEVAGADLVHAVDAVMTSLPEEGRDPAMEMVLFELEGDSLTVFGTDRYRLAACTIPCLLRAGDPSVAFAVPARDVGRLTVSAGHGDAFEVMIKPGSVTLSARSEPVTVLGRVAGPLPDLRSLLPAPADGLQVSADATALASRLNDPDYTVTDTSTGTRVAYLADGLSRGGELILLPGHHAGTPGVVPVNARYLLDAISAGPQGRLNITLRGQHPLAIRFGDDPATTAVVMPRRD